MTRAQRRIMMTSDLQHYEIHTLESAPKESRRALHALNSELGFIPNVAAIMAESPDLLNGFVGVFEAFHGGTFSNAERQVLLLSNAVANTCAWAVALHSALALHEGVAADDVRAIRETQLPRDARQAALSGFTRALIEKRGHADTQDLATFMRGGFRPEQALEVVLGIAASAFTNYTGNITHPALEDRFKPHAWAPR
jgi:alkylhydroperoxidase family enzyme